MTVHAQSPQYTVTDLGAFFYPSAINDSGQVVGSFIHGSGSAMFYSEGVARVITPPNGVLAQARGINNLGEVVGEVTFCDTVNGDCVNAFARAFIYNSKRNTYNILGTLGGRDSRAFAINDSGQVTGYSDIATGNFEHAFIFENGAFNDIGAVFGSADTLALGINANGQVAGHASSNTTTRGAFLYDNGFFLFFEPTGTARDINNRGELVGNFGGNDDGSGRAFLYTHGARLDLGTLGGGTFARANAVNDLGQVVGVSGPSWFVSEGQKAFIYNSGAAGSVMQDLNAMVPALAGRVLTEATDINDAGQIVTNGKLNGEDHGFLLTPTLPMLLTEPNTNKAIAVQSVMYLRDPFTVTTTHNLSTDTRTRLTILVRNLETTAGDNIAPPTVQAENSLHQIISLPVEYFGKVPKATWLTQIVVRLPDEVDGAGDLQLTVSFRGQTSNKAVITVTQ